jgi:hypothetical protein
MHLGFQTRPATRTSSRSTPDARTLRKQKVHRISRNHGDPDI